MIMWHERGEHTGDGMVELGALAHNEELEKKPKI